MSKHICAKDDRKLPIDRPCSACSGGDYKMEYHDHCPPFRESHPTVPAPEGAAAPDITKKHSKHCFAVQCINVPIREDGSLDYAAWEKHCNCEAAPDALQRAADKFREYAAIHKAKGTDDGDRKAVSNTEMAEMCEASLRATSKPPADAGEIARIAAVHFPDTMHTSTRWTLWGRKKCVAALTDYAKPLVERNKELEKYYDDALDYIDRGRAAEARVDDLQRERDHFKSAYSRKLDEHEEALKDAQQLCSERDSLTETLGRVQLMLNSLDRQGGLGYDKHAEIRKSIADIAAALGPVAGEGKE